MEIFGEDRDEGAALAAVLAGSVIFEVHASPYLTNPDPDQTFFRPMARDAGTVAEPPALHSLPRSKP